MTPEFRHDCDACTFLGHYNDHDLYYCTKTDGWPKFLARYGDYGAWPAARCHHLGLSFAQTSLRELEQDDTQRALRVAYLIAADLGMLLQRGTPTDKDEAFREWLAESLRLWPDGSDQARVRLLQQLRRQDREGDGLPTGRVDPEGRFSAERLENPRSLNYERSVNHHVEDRM